MLDGLPYKLPHSTDNVFPRRAPSDLDSVRDQREIGRMNSGAHSLDEVFVRASDGDDWREVAHDVPYRCRHDWLAGGHVLECLGRIDEFGCFIDRERHEAHLERLDVSRQGVVGPLPEPENVV